nr:MAG TPA: hypothetical protein [Caudoviricetes sp.]
MVINSLENINGSPQILLFEDFFIFRFYFYWNISGWCILIRLKIKNFIYTKAL